MASIIGFGGASLQANDPEALYSWYEQHVGLVRSQGSFAFPAPTQHTQVVFALFKQDDAYFPPAQKAMINLQVDDLDGLLDRLIAEGVTVDPKRETYDFGKFGWFTDPKGNRVELCQPVAAGEVNPRMICDGKETHADYIYNTESKKKLRARLLLTLASTAT